MRCDRLGLDDTTSANTQAGGHASGVAVLKPQNPLYKGDWEERMDKTSDRIFYVNHRTGEQTSQRPDEMNHKPEEKGSGLGGDGHQSANPHLHRFQVNGDLESRMIGSSTAMKLGRGERSRSISHGGDGIQWACPSGQLAGRSGAGGA